MSAPGSEFREAEYLGLGFLAITSSDLLNRLLAGQQIDTDDKFTLRRAEEFLVDVSSGARLVTSGLNANARAMESVRHLAYSVEPLKYMQDRIQTANVGDEFEKMASAISTALSEAPASEIRTNELVNAREFFKQLHVFLIGLVEVGQRRIGAGGNRLGVSFTEHV